MDALVVCGLAAVVVWSLLSRRLERFRVTGPLTLVAIGAVAGLFFGDDLGQHLDTEIAEKVVEIILAILLFVDATEVRRGFLGGEGKLVSRLLVIALPLSLAAAAGVGWLLIPGQSWSVLLIIACIVIPTDFAASAGMLRDRQVPSRMRHTLNVESGYNDGIVSPLFIFALAAAEGRDAGGLGPAIEEALVASAVAIGVGAVIGTVLGFAIKRAARAEWLTEQSIRIAIVVIPLLVYFVAVPLQGNGFVAAFIAGIAFRTARQEKGAEADKAYHRELSAVDDIGLATSLYVWFMFGAVTVLTFETGFDWAMVLLGLLALTVLRMLPVYVALLGSSTRWGERTAIGLAGPRGTASIVFGLLAFNALDDGEAYLALYVMVVVVLGSIIFHGGVVPRLMAPLTAKARTAS